MGLRDLFYKIKIKLTQNIKYDEAIKEINSKLLIVDERCSRAFPGASAADSEYCRFLRKKEKCGDIVKIAVEVGGGLGDYIVVLPILDSIIASGECIIDFYTHDNIDFPLNIYAGRPNLSIHSHKFTEFRFEDYDLVLHIDHFTTRRYCKHFRYISHCMPSFYHAMSHVERFNSSHRCDSEKQPWRNAVTLKQANFGGLNRWTYLSPGDDVFGMKEQRAGIMLDWRLYKKYEKSKLCSRRYIVLNRGADPRNGGVNQTKVWLKERYEEFIALFKKRHPSILVIQAAVNRESSLKGADDVIRDVDLDYLKIILKNAAAFVGSEGGLVHLASQMSTPCAAVFGPTPAYYYGYARNKNIVSPYCSDCMGAIENWYTGCLRGHGRAECMWAVTGEMVLNAVDEILSRGTSVFFEDDDATSGIDELLTGEAVVGFIGKNFVNESMRIAKDCAKSIIISPDYLEECGVGDGDDSCENGIQRTMSHNRTMRLLKENGVTPLIANYFNIPKDDGYFDVLAMEADIQSAPYAEYAMKELLRALRPDGRLLLYSGGKAETAFRKKASPVELHSRGKYECVEENS